MTDRAKRTAPPKSKKLASSAKKPTAFIGRLADVPLAAYLRSIVDLPGSFHDVPFFVHEHGKRSRFFQRHPEPAMPDDQVAAAMGIWDTLFPFIREPEDFPFFRLEGETTGGFHCGATISQAIDSFERDGFQVLRADEVIRQRLIPNAEDTIAATRIRLRRAITAAVPAAEASAAFAIDVIERGGPLVDSLPLLPNPVLVKALNPRVERWNELDRRLADVLVMQGGVHDLLAFLSLEERPPEGGIDRFGLLCCELRSRGVSEPDLLRTALRIPRLGRNGDSARFFFAPYLDRIGDALDAIAAAPAPEERDELLACFVDRLLDPPLTLDFLNWIKDRFLSKAWGRLSEAVSSGGRPDLFVGRSLLALLDHEPERFEDAVAARLPALKRLPDAVPDYLVASTLDSIFPMRYAAARESACERLGVEPFRTAPVTELQAPRTASGEGQPTGPTREMLSSLYGFRVPEAFWKLVAFAFAEGGDGEDWDQCKALTCLSESCSFDLTGPLSGLFGLGEPDDRYPNEPPEFRTFGALGTDGVAYGFVVLAPELEGIEWPVAEFQPMADQCVGALGLDFRESVDLLISRRMSFRRRKKEGAVSAEAKDRLRRLITLLSIDPTSGKADWKRHMKAAIRPVVPAGWQHVPCSDGVGVLAPLSAFVSAQRGSSAPFDSIGLDADDLGASLFVAVRALRTGHPATALVALNETFARHWTGHQYKHAFQRLVSERIRAYEALGRRVHAEVLRRTPSP